MTGGAAGARTAQARRFVAIALPDRQRHALDRALVPVRDAHRHLRWSRPDGWHITLAFLGSVESERVAGATTALRTAVDAADTPRALTLSEAGRFDRRVLWLGIEDDPSGALGTLATTVRGALLDHGFDVDRKPLRAHLTLARSSRAAPITDAVVDDARTIEDALPPAAANWTPDSLQLWRSVAGSGPASYETDAAVTLPRSGRGR